MHHVLQDAPQRDGDGEEDEHAGYEPGLAVSPDLHRERERTQHPGSVKTESREREEEEALTLGGGRGEEDLVFLQLPDTERQDGHQQEDVEDQDQRTDPPPPLSTGARHDGGFTLNAS